MRTTRFGAVSLLIASATACGPAPAPVAAPVKPDVVAPVATATASASAGPDLSPVSEPADVVGIVRWKSPITTAGNLAGCAGISPMFVEINARMGADVMLRKLVRGGPETRQLAALISLDAPIDLLVALDPSDQVRMPLWAVAMGLGSLDGAKVAISPEGQQPKEIAPGMWALKGERGASCAVTASAGHTPARLVCAERDKTLLALAPYLARTMPSLDLGGSDIHAEARVAVVRKRYGEVALNALQALPGAVTGEYGTGDARTDKPLFEAATAVEEDVAKLFGDVQKVTLDLKSERSGACLRASAELELGTKNSWLASTLSDRLDRDGPPPPIYWRQPKDADLALYARGADPARFTAVLAKAREIVDGELAKEGVGSAAERKKIVELIDLPFGKDSNVTLSHGTIDAAIPADASAKGAQQKAIEATLTRMTGWTLIGVDEGPAAMKKIVTGLANAYKQKGVEAGLKKLAGSEAKYLPAVKSGTAPSSLGAGSEALEITISNLEVPPPPNGPAPKPAATMSLKVNVILMPDGNTTWLAIGLSKDDLVKKLLAVKSGASDKDQLSSRAGLEGLKNGKQMLGGFVSAAMITQPVAAYFLGDAVIDPRYASAEGTQFAQALLGLPNKAQTPLLIQAGGAQGTTTKLSLAFDVQQGTVEDLKTLGVGNYALLRRWGLLP
jgi:hypothetical protein